MKPVTREFRLGLIEAYKRNKTEQEQQLQSLQNVEPDEVMDELYKTREDEVEVLMNNIRLNERIIQELEKRLD